MSNEKTATVCQIYSREQERERILKELLEQTRELKRMLRSGEVGKQTARVMLTVLRQSSRLVREQE